MKQAVVEELHKPARRNYPRRKFEVRGLDETWHADLIEMQPYASTNEGYRYKLTVIDVFFQIRLGCTVAAAMSSILKQGRVPKNLQTNFGKEFYNKNFQELMEKYKINLYSTYSNLKASICERFNRTLKTKMWMKFTENGNSRWVDILTDLLDAYNNTKHRTIGMKPKDVTAANEAQVLQRFATKIEPVNKPKFKVNDKVRVSRSKLAFEKGYTPNWTTEIFTITEIRKTRPITYRLKDYKNEPITGGFYEQELSKVKYPDVYLVEKVIRKKDNQAFVKWLGFDNSHNSWVNLNDI